MQIAACFASDLLVFIRLRIVHLFKETNDKESPIYACKQHSYKDYINQYGIIQLNLGRRTGNTTLAVKILEEFDNSIMFVASSVIKKFNEEKFLKVKNRVFFPGSGERGGNCFDGILVIDNAFHFSEAKIEQLVKQHHPTVLILLG